MEQITTLDQLIEHAVLATEGKATWSDVELVDGCATISVRVCGPGWDHKIDARGARYIVDLQSKLDKLWGDYMGEAARPPLLKVELRDGSNDLLALLEPYLREIIAKLDAEQVMEIVKYALLCGTGLFGAWFLFKDRAHKRETEAETKKVALQAEAETERLTILTEAQRKQAEIERARQEEMLKVLGAAVERLGAALPSDPQAESYYTQPIRAYVNELDPENRLSFAGTPPVKVKQARPYFKAKRKPRSRTRWTTCDNAFNCLGLNLEKDDPRLEIEQDGIRLSALLGRLPDEQREALSTQIDTRMKNRQMPFLLNIRLDVYFTDSGISHGTVVGIGAAREGDKHCRLSEIPGKVKQVFDEFTNPKDEAEA